MGSFFSCAFPARFVLCRLLGRDQICSLCPSVCSSGHNGTAPYLYPRARPIISMRDGPAMQFSSCTPIAPPGANKCRATPMLHPFHLQGVCLPVDFHVSAHQRNFQLDYHPITSVFATAPRGLLLAAWPSYTPAPKPPPLDGVKPPCSM